MLVFSIMLAVAAVVLLVSSALYITSLVVIWRFRNLKYFDTLFYRLWWNEGVLDLCCFLFFTITMYGRCFEFMVPIFLWMNRYTWWTKFAQITQEHIMYIQINNVLLTICSRLLNICFPMHRLTVVVEKMKRWQIFILQISLPTVTVIPLYFLFDFQYGLKGTSRPLLLSTKDLQYDKYIFAIGLAYRVTAFFLCICGYLTIFRETQLRARRSHPNILIHGASLIFALLAVLSTTICRRFQIGEKLPLIRLSFFTTMLWIPCTNILATVATAKVLRSRIRHPCSEPKLGVGHSQTKATTRVVLFPT